MHCVLFSKEITYLHSYILGFLCCAYNHRAFRIMYRLYVWKYLPQQCIGLPGFDMWLILEVFIFVLSHYNVYCRIETLSGGKLGLTNKLPSPSSDQLGTTVTDTPQCAELMMLTHKSVKSDELIWRIIAHGSYISIYKSPAFSHIFCIHVITSRYLFLFESVIYSICFMFILESREHTTFSVAVLMLSLFFNKLTVLSCRNDMCINDY